MYIDDSVIRNGRIDIAALQPLARLGYMDYSFLSARVESRAWDGVYR